MASLLRAKRIVNVSNNEAKSRFQYEEDGKLSRIDYTMRNGALVLTHTEVPQELSGRGIAQKLVTAALDHARAKKLRVVPQCSYVASYIKKHPEYNDLVAEE